MKNILPIIRRRKAKNIYAVHYELDFKKHNIVVRFASGNEKTETIQEISRRNGHITFNIVVGKLAIFMSKFLKGMKGFYSGFNKQK